MLTRIFAEKNNKNHWDFPWFSIWKTQKSHIFTGKIPDFPLFAHVSPTFSLAFSPIKQLPGPNACGVLSHGLRLRGLSLAGETLAEAIGLLEWWDWGLLLGYYVTIYNYDGYMHNWTLYIMYNIVGIYCCYLMVTQKYHTYLYIYNYILYHSE